MYINDITISITFGTIICYADDMVILFEGKIWYEAVKNAETGTSDTRKWLDAN